MKIKNLFNVVLFSFLMIVPLIPIKYKFYMLPISSDFILGTVLILVGIVCVIKEYKNGEKPFEAAKTTSIKILSFFIIAFIIISAVSISYASHKIVALSESIRFLEYTFIFYLILFIADELTIERSFVVFYLTMIFAAIFGIAQLIFNWSSFTAGGFFGRGRIFATFVNPNYWGAAVNLVIFYPLIKLLEGERENRKVHIFSFLLFLINLVFCSSRASWLGFILGLSLLGIMRYRKQVIYMLGIILACINLPFLRERTTRLYFLQERINLWKTGFLMFKDNFFTGVGNGNYIFNYKDYLSKYGITDPLKPKLSIQNSYIKVFAELGFLGGISFLGMYTSIFAICYRVYKNSVKYKFIALAFICFGASYFLQNLFNNLAFIPQLNVFVWIISAMLIKGLYIERQGE